MGGNIHFGLSMNNNNDQYFDTKINRPKRIMIFGRPGGGKSTFAIRLSEQLTIPVIHLDKYFYIDNWVERDYQEFLSIQLKFVNQNQWIIDGNNTKSIEMRYQRAEVCLYFNYPKWLCYFRVIKRLLIKHPHIDDRANGCKETVRWSLLKYMWNFESRVRENILLLKTKHPNVKFFEIRNNSDLHQLKFYEQGVTP